MCHVKKQLRKWVTFSYLFQFATAKPINAWCVPLCVCHLQDSFSASASRFENRTRPREKVCFECGFGRSFSSRWTRRRNASAKRGHAVLESRKKAHRITYSFVFSAIEMNETKTLAIEKSCPSSTRKSS